MPVCVPDDDSHTPPSLLNPPGVQISSLLACGGTPVHEKALYNLSPARVARESINTGLGTTGLARLGFDLQLTAAASTTCRSALVASRILPYSLLLQTEQRGWRDCRPFVRLPVCFETSALVLKEKRGKSPAQLGQMPSICGSCFLVLPTSPLTSRDGGLIEVGIGREHYRKRLVCITQANQVCTDTSYEYWVWPPPLLLFHARNISRT
ncbi:hypothetical protein LX36DRAFT_349749 [Colletotrichum falcatum]|nr:hypothetical protein LX36DRAFT_349749 [Colletotrichum falcatum]